MINCLYYEVYIFFFEREKIRGRWPYKRSYRKKKKIMNYFGLLWAQYDKKFQNFRSPIYFYIRARVLVRFTFVRQQNEKQIARAREIYANFHLSKRHLSRQSPSMNSRNYIQFKKKKKKTLRTAKQTSHKTYSVCGEREREKKIVDSRVRAIITLYSRAKRRLTNH